MQQEEGRRAAYFFPEHVAGSMYMQAACTGRLTSVVLKSIALLLSLFYHGLIEEKLMKSFFL